MWTDLRCRLRSLFRRRAVERELDEELRLHLQRQIDAYVARGLDAQAARRRARLEFGSLDLIKEEHREARGVRALEHSLRDLHHGLRALGRHPALAATAMLTLACGIAATGLVLSAVDAILVRPLDVEAPEELFVLRRLDEPRARFPVAFQRTLGASPAGFADTLASVTFPVTVIQGMTGTRASAGFVSANYFSLLGVSAGLGRVFHDERDRDLVIISDRFWKERFEGRRSVVGASLRIGNATFSVGGVAPRGFHGLQPDLSIDVWVPLSTLEAAVPISGFRPAVDVVGRLPLDVQPSTAASRISVDLAQWITADPTERARWNRSAVFLLPAGHGLESAVRERFETSLPLMLGIAVSLWVTTIVNVTGLLTARLRQRSREVGLRLALGASSMRLFGQFLAESAVLVTGGFVLGIVATVSVVGALPAWIPSWAGVDLRVSPVVLLMTTLTAIVAMLVMTAAQALSVDRRVLAHLSPDVMPFGRGRRLRVSTCLVTAQVALTLPLIVIAGLLGQTLRHLQLVETGFERNDLLQIDVEPILVGYSGERARAYYRTVLEHLRSTPGIVDASVSSGGALSGFEGMTELDHEGRLQAARVNAIDDRYFRTLGVRVLAGRAFDPVEAWRPRGVMILNAALARRLFGSEHAAIGRSVISVDGRTRTDRTVVGVVDNTADVDLRNRSAAVAYVPVGDSPLLLIHVRTASDATSLIPVIRRTLSSLEASVPILGIETIQARHRRALERERLLASLSAVVGWLALVVSAVGIFGRVSHDVSARIREVGIRSALGANRTHIAALFLRGTAGIVVAGLAFGVTASLGASRVLEGVLYGVSATSSGTYIGSACLVVVVAGIATLLPLARALGAGTAANLIHGRWS